MRWFTPIFAIWLSLWTNVARSRLLTSPEQLNEEYDFIIMGGGTAGSVLAHRLSEISSVKVLVVEAGISNEGIQEIMVPFLATSVPGTLVDWNYTSTPQAGLNGRSIAVPRGFVLGGSSSINYMVWMRGSNDVWDNWANLTEDEGWSWKNIEPYFLKTNRLVASADGHNTTGQVDPSAYGHGPVQVSVAGLPTELDARVINASKILGKHILDLNDGKTIGFTYETSAIGSGQRSSSATAYLEPVLNRTNLDVLIMTRVTKLIPSFPNTSTVESAPDFKTIEVAQTAAGPRYQVKARKEVILSGGTVGTVQVLLLSGIGPKNDLGKLGIKSIVNLPDVGQHLADHPLFPNYYSVNSNQTFDDVFRNQTLFDQNLEQWVQSKQGLFAAAPSNTFGFVRFPENSTVLKGTTNPASGPLSANTETIFADGFTPTVTTPRPNTGHYMSVRTIVVSPTSRGSITLNSSSPFVYPLIDLNLLGTQFDIDAMVQAMKDAQTFLQTRPWLSDNFVLGPFGDLANAHTDEQKAELIRNNAATVFHPVGTARMAPTRQDANWGVTDSTLLVKGTTGLRIVDASVFPQIPECHPQALVYTIAERASDLIKEAHNLS